MKISHEVPLCLLEESRNFNDYDYALVHLFDTHPEYYNFFRKSVELGRTVLLDNSIFELGEAFDMDRFAHYIKELKPTEYIIPDKLENLKGTIENIELWLKKYNNLPGKKIAVIQGSTVQELEYCYQLLSEEDAIDKIAISFDYSVYLKSAPSENKWESYMNGRIYLLDYFIFKHLINYNKPHHLLGCALPQEFKHYNVEKLKESYRFIESLDTSNPIVHGYHNILYNNNGLSEKVSQKLVTLLDDELTKQQKQNIYFNINKFREFTQ